MATAADKGTASAKEVNGAFLATEAIYAVRTFFNPVQAIKDAVQPPPGAGDESSSLNRSKSSGGD